MDQQTTIYCVVCVLVALAVLYYVMQPTVIETERYGGGVPYYGGGLSKYYTGGSGYYGGKQSGFRNYQIEAEANDMQIGPYGTYEAMENVGAEDEIKGAPQVMNMPSNFYLQKNRFLAENGKEDGQVIHGNPSKACWTQNDAPGQRSFSYESGANGTTSDLVWHSMSPRMIMQDNCMNCGDYSTGKDYNAPSGISSDLTASYDGTMEAGAQSQYDLISDELDLPSYTGEMAHTLSPKMNTGIPGIRHDCVRAQVQDTNNCGCGSFGKKLYGFH